MKPVKFLILAAGAIGVVAFFLPLIAVSQDGVAVKVSAKQLVFGIDSLEDVSAAGKAVRGTEEEKQAIDQADKARKYTGPLAVIVFVPSLLVT